MTNIGGVCSRHRSYSDLKDHGNEPLLRFPGLGPAVQL
jgi:hypothetical protein